MKEQTRAQVMVRFPNLIERNQFKNAVDTFYNDSEHTKVIGNKDLLVYNVSVPMIPVIQQRAKDFNGQSDAGTPYQEENSNEN